MRTPLFEVHSALGAKMVDFCGWEMPLLYEGIISEHLAVRNRVGIFDVSHMGKIDIVGPQAESLLNFLSTSELEGKFPGTATYTIWTDEFGMSLDDLIVYKENQNHFFVVVNACNRQKDLEHLKHHAKEINVSITDRSLDEGILAIQGPLAEELFINEIPQINQIKTMHFLTTMYLGKKISISRTGYTGSSGFEIIAPRDMLSLLWEHLMKKGKELGIKPIGLGARNTLRLEMGYALYGHELSESIAPSETICSWAIKWQKKNFLGKQALEKLEISKKKRIEYGIILKEEGVIRDGYPIYQDEIKIGYVTSGIYSPSLNRSIGIALVEKKMNEGEVLNVKIRQNFCQAVVVKLPFYQKK